MTRRKKRQLKIDHQYGSDKMITLTPERKIRHNLLNIISNNQAMVYLKRKDILNAIEDCKLSIYEAYRDKRIDQEIFNQLSDTINETFEE